MKRLLPPSSHSNLRVFTACLLSFLIMVSPIASVAASFKAASSPASTKTGAKDNLTPEERMEASLFKPTAPVMPLGGITATKSDSFPAHPSGQAEPGDQISYTVDVGNTSGTDATGVTFTDQIDANTTLVPGSVNTTPIAYDKSVTTNEDTAVGILVGADAENDPVTINVITPVAHGTLSGTAPNMTYTPDADYNGSDSFTFKLNDGKADSIDTGTISITITSVNDAPVVTAGGTLNYTENQAAQIIDNSITVTDVDNANVTGATISITSGFQSGADVLSFVNTPNITGTYNAATGVLTLSGSDTKANYQSALRSVKYSNSSEAPTATPRTISWVVTDGTTPSTPVTSTVNVTPVNDAPVLTVGGTLNYTEDQAATALNSSLTVTDVDSANLTGATVSITANFASGQDVLSFTPSGAVTGSYNAATGVLTLSGSDTVATYQTVLRSVTYSNSSQNPSSASRTVTWTATDGTDTSAPATSTINVTSVNDAPVVTAGATITYTENDPATAIDTTVTVTDVDNANVTGATVSITSGFQSGADVLSFVNTPNITGSYNAATGVLTLSGSDTTANYQTALRNVKYSNSSEAPTATPRTISWVVTDGITPSTPVTSTVNVVAVDDAPVLTVPGSQTFNEDTTQTFDTAHSNRIRVSDPDSGANNITVTVSSTHGNITVSTSGVTVTNNTTHSVTIVGTATNIDTAINGMTYTPDSNYNGSDTLSLHADDGGFNGTGGPLTADASVTFTINAVNDAPVYTGAAKTATVIANMPRIGVGGLLTGVTDPDDGEYGFTSVMKVNSVDFSGCACTVAINNATTGTFNITPNVGFAGTTSFTYKVEDNGRPGIAISNPITVTITVTGPIIYFVKAASVGNCTLGNECSLSTAVTAIGANTDRFIFISDANTHTANVPLNDGGSIIGQGLTGFADFDTFFGISAPSGTIARPSINQSRPTVNGTITLGGTATDTSVSPNVLRGSQARGLNINNTTGAAAGIVGNGKTSVVVSDMNVTTTSGTSVSMTNTSGTFTFGDVTSSSGSPIAWSGGADSGTVTFNDVTGSAVPAGNTGVSISTNVSDFVFHKISTTGGAKGILVNATTGGTFTVNGTSTTAGTGGTIQNATNNGIQLSSASGVTLKNMNLTNNASSQTATNLNCGNNLVAGDTTLCVANLYLNSVSTVALTNLSVTGSTQEGIAGTSVSGFTLANSTISGNGNEDYEDGMLFKNLTGTVSITNVNLQNNFSRQAHIFNTAGSLTMTATGSLFGRTVAPGVSSQQGLLMELGGTSSSSVDIGTSSFVKNGNGNGLAITVTGSATLGSAATHSSLHNSTSLSENAAHVFISTSGSGSGYFDTLNNSMTKAGLQSIDYFVSPGSTASGQLTGIIQGNTIGTSGVAASACNGGGCDGMTLDRDGAGAMSLRIQSNTIQQVNTNGIALGSTLSGPLNASIISNTIRQPSGGANQGNAMFLNIGANSGSTTTACLTIGGSGVQNIISDVAGNAWDINGSAAAIFLNTKNATTTRLPGMAGSGAAAAQTFITGNNTFTLAAGSPVLAQTFNGSQITGGAACSTPLLLGEGGVEATWNSSSMLSSFAGISLNDLSFTSSPSTCGGSAAARSGFASSSIVATSLNQQQLDSIVSAAVQRWTATGLTPQQVATLRHIKFDVANLSGSYLGEADGNHILVDTNAGGNGWYVDATPQDDSEFGHAVSATRRYTDPMSAPAGHVDLLTAIMHEIGHRLDIPDSYAAADRDSLMYGYLTKGERRLPITGQAEQAVYGVNHDAHFLSLLLNDSKPQATKAQAMRSASRSFNGHASSKSKALISALMPSGEIVTSNIGSLPTGKHVQITFKVTVNVPFSGTQVSNQGTVAGTMAPATPFSIVTDDPATGASNDATITPVLGPTDAVDDNYTTFKNTPLNIAAPGVVGNDTNNPTVSAVGSCADVTAPFSGCNTAQNGTVTLNADGSFSYTPPTGYTGADSFTYTATNAAGSDTATVNITVTDTSDIYINEVLFNPPGTDAPNEYIELRGTANAVIPTGTYLVAVEGDTADNTGDVQTIINLSGLQFGTNGFLVLLQNGNTYTTAAGATVVTSTTTGFGGLPGSIWSADGGATDIEDASVTFMLVQTGATPTLTDDIDANDDGTPDGSVYGGWSVRDSIGVLDGTSASDHAYGAINFSNNTGTNGTATGTTILVGFTAGYVGRIGDSTGSAAADWVASVPAGAQPNFTLGNSSNTEPSAFAGKPLNHIGASNFTNLAPVNTVPGAQSTNEDTPLVFTGATQISISDPDAGSAPVQVTLTASNGIITLSGTSGLSFNSGANGTASMNFNGTITDINAALNNLTFTPDPNYFGPASLTILTDDLGNTGVGGNKTDSDTVNITVGSVNDAPTADAQSVTTNEDTAKPITLTGSDIETPPGSLTYIIVSGPAHGSLNPSGTGASQTYTPNSNYNGSDSFTFKVNDGTADSLPATVSITVNPVNDTPTANAQSVSTNEDTPLGITLTGTDTETASGSLVFNVTVQPTHGSLTGSAPNLTYTPNADYNGPDSFKFTVTDTGDGSSPALTSAEATVTINVGAVNDAPTADAQSVSTNEDTPKAITLTGSDIDTPAASLTYIIVSGPSHGTVSPGTGPGRTYTPTGNYNGPDSFTFKINDGSADSNVATVSITVNAVNDAPTADAQSVSTNEETPLGITLTGTDVETASGSLVFNVTVQPTHGSLTGSAPNLTYTPDANYNGPDSFKFTVTDTGDGSSAPLTSAEATISITVNGINDAPVLDNSGNMTLNAINEDVANASNNGTLVSDIIASAGGDRITDIDAGALEGLAVIAVDNTKGTWQFSIDNGTNWTPFGTPDQTTARLLASDANTRIRFVPAANFNGTVNPGITFRAWDQTSGTNGATADTSTNGGTTAFSIMTETASITVNPVNDAPTANAQTVGTLEDTPVGITLTGSDVETASGSLVFNITAAPANGVLSGSGANRTYTPNPNYNGPDSFKFTVTDTGDGSSPALTSAEATVTINVGAVNDAPTADAQSVSTNEDTAKAITLTGSDIDTPSGSLTYIIVTGPSHGTVSPGTGANRTYTPTGNYNGPDSFTFKINDGTADSNTATVSITVNAVNDAPTANPQSVSTNEDTPKAITLTGSDTETAPASLVFNVTVQPTHGVLSGTGASRTYTPNADYNGPDSFKFTVTDTGDGSSPALTSSEATVSITVNGVNDAPVNSIPGPQGATKNGQLVFSAANSNLVSISDVDAGSNSLKVTLTATHGTLTLSGTSGLAFTVGDGTQDATMTFTGNLTNINAALNGLIYEPTNGYDGPATIQLTTDDQGNTGSGGAKTDTDTINVTINPGGILSFSSATYTVAESGGSITITVNRVGGSTGTTKVNYATSNGTATSPQDYTATSGQLTFNNGETTKTFVVPIVNDTLNEANETINLTLSNVTGSGELGSPSTAVVTITDDDATPSLSINDATVTEGNSGTVNAVFTVTLSAQSGQTVTVNYATANGTATAPSDYQAQSNTLTFAPGETTKTVTVVVNGDTASEPDETFFVNLTGATNASISDNQGLGTIISDDSPVIQFSASTYTVAEDALRVIVTVNRLGDISKPATVDYATSDSAGLTNCSVANGIASSRCDYAVSVGTLRFAANEASKTISIPIVNDVYVEGPENFTITLSHQTGGEAGSPTVATITITDNDNGGAPNPMDDNAFFIRQLYIDFLGREPDPPGLRGWLAILNNCPVDDTSCDRVHIAEGFARSDEFAGRGYFIYRIYRASLGRKPDYAEFIPDMAKVSGFLSPQDLEANKQAFVDEFVTRTEFRGRYDALDNAGYVNALETTALVGLPNKQALIDDLNAGRKTRAQVLRAVIETTEVYTKSTNEAFVVMEYFGFLRRDPDALYKGWIEQFNHSNIYRLIINGFVFSAEYRQRFGPN